MRTTVRSVGGSYGLGWRCVKLSTTAAFAQTASERSPSIVGASEGSILTARTLGRISDCGAAAEAGAAAATSVSPAGPREACAAPATSHMHTSASAANGAPALGLKPLPRNPFPPISLVL